MYDCVYVSVWIEVWVGVSVCVYSNVIVVSISETVCVGRRTITPPPWGFTVQTNPLFHGLDQLLFILAPRNKPNVLSSLGVDHHPF